MIKIYILICFIILCNLFVHAQSSWSALTSGTTNNLYSVYFTNANIGYAVGYNGTILKTTDAGINWLLINSGTTKFLCSIFFTDVNNGYILLKEDGGILKTNNGGNSWSSISTIGANLTQHYFSELYFTSNNIGYAVGRHVLQSTPWFEYSEDVIAKTIDGGYSWTIQYFEVNGGLLSVSFINDSIGFAVGNNGAIYKTSNAGTNWVAQTSGTSKSLTSVYFTDVNTGYIVGCSSGLLTGIILKTVNGGTLWSLQSIDTFPLLNSVHFPHINNGYIVGTNGTILNTSNGGTNWVAQTSGISNSLSSVYFIDTNTGYTVGDGGKILKTTNGGVSTNLNFETINIDNLKIYPNPSNEKVTFEFNNPNHKIISIYIIDLTGKVIYETKTTQDKYDFKRNSIQSGIYIVKVSGENNIFGKIIIE